MIIRHRNYRSYD